MQFHDEQRDEAWLSSDFLDTGAHLPFLYHGVLGTHLARMWMHGEPCSMYTNEVFANAY
jgi:hypothetical protein